jgi:hypothetical protein
MGPAQPAPTISSPIGTGVTDSPGGPRGGAETGVRSPWEPSRQRRGDLRPPFWTQTAMAPHRLLHVPNGRQGRSLASTSEEYVETEPRFSGIQATLARMPVDDLRVPASTSTIRGHNTGRSGSVQPTLESRTPTESSASQQEALGADQLNSAGRLLRPPGLLTVTKLTWVNRNMRPTRD